MKWFILTPLYLAWYFLIFLLVLTNALKYCFDHLFYLNMKSLKGIEIFVNKRR